jgi:hypothetical protein
MEKKYPHNSNPLDKEWNDMVKKLLKPLSRLRLTLEEEELIKKIANKL